MIPKVIHYCWFGGNSFSPIIKKCIDSWKKILPDYEIKEWNEANFDINSIPYTAEAYKHKKYAFVSDYARFKALYEEGGIYLDVDVEVLKPLDIFLDNISFTGFESTTKVAPGLIIGSEPNTLLMNEILTKYHEKKFILDDGSVNYETVVTHVTDILIDKGLVLNGELQRVDGLTIYPSEYFSPKSFITNKIILTPNTHTIHHYAGTWVPWYTKMEKNICSFLKIRNRYVIKRSIEKFNSFKFRIFQ